MFGFVYDHVTRPPCPPPVPCLAPAPAVTCPQPEPCSVSELYEVSADAGTGWRSIEKLEYMEGPWRTSDGGVLVSLAYKDMGANHLSPWRLTAEMNDGTIIICTLYERLQEPAAGAAGLPWRLGYCRGRPGVDPEGPAVATRVTVLRAPGQHHLRFTLGAELDIDIFQVQ